MWQSVIQDAGKEIRKTRVRIARLQKSIKIIRKKIDTGEPWPISQHGANQVTINGS